MPGAETAFMVLTIISSVLVRLSLWPDFRRVHKAQFTGEVAVLPVIVLFVNCYVLAWYGYLDHNIFPLFSTSVFGLVTCSFFFGIYYRWTDSRQFVNKLCVGALVVILLVTISGELGVTKATGQSESAVSTTMGAVSFATAIGNYGSPLATIRRVMLTKSTASMPFTMCLMNFFNSVCWIVYGVIISDLFVFVPNAVGGVFTSIQLALYVIYPSNANSKMELPTVMIEPMSGFDRHASLSVIVVQDDNLARKDSALNFVAIQSPLARYPSVSTRV